MHCYSTELLSDWYLKQTAKVCKDTYKCSTNQIIAELFRLPLL